MTPRDLAYWLQGYFEISAEVPEALWTKEAKQIVLKHLELVKATPGDYSTETMMFIGWLESAIEFNASAGAIREKLNSIFEHVIDPTTPGDAGQQNQIHHGEGWGARC